MTLAAYVARVDRIDLTLRRRSQMTLYRVTNRSLASRTRSCGAR